MKFGADRPRDRPPIVVPRPEVKRRKGFGQIFADRHTVPPHKLAMPQSRYSSGWRILHDRGFACRLEERNNDFLELHPDLLQNEPRSQGPRRVVLVAEIDREIGHMPRPRSTDRSPL